MSDLTHDEAARLLAEIDGARIQTRDALRGYWFPQLLFGVLTALSALLWNAPDWTIPVFWLVVSPVGWLLIGRFYCRREAATGVGNAPLPYLVIGAAMIVGAFAIPAATHGVLQSVGSTFAIAAGYVGFAVVERDPRLGALAAAIAVVPAAALASDLSPEAAFGVTAALSGAVLIVSGLAFRAGRRQSPR